MNSDLSVLLLNADGVDESTGEFNDGGCGFYRIMEPARVAAANGVDIDIQGSLPVETSHNPDGTLNVHRIMVQPDVIVFQRPLLAVFFKAILTAKSMGIATVVEIDDDLMDTHPQNMAYPHINPIDSPHSNWTWLKACCEVADLVTVSTPHLGHRYAEHGRFAVLRNCMPESVFESTHTVRDLSNPRLGWTGTLQTHPTDFDDSASHLGTLIRERESRVLHVVGDGSGLDHILRVPEEKIDATGWVPRAEFVSTVNDHIDVGIVPLDVTHFNTSKSYLKQLEYASQGIPSVVSPLPEQIRLAEVTGNKVARKPKQWIPSLKRLLDDPDHLLEKSAQVREAVRPLTYENRADQWIDAWKRARDIRLSGLSD